MKGLPGLQEPDFDSGWISLLNQAVQIKHDLCTRKFKLVSIEGSDDIKGTFPTYPSAITGTSDLKTGNFVQVTGLNHITVGRCPDGNMYIDPNLNWKSVEARFIKIKIWV